ncbi:MAG: ferrous iron transport protein B [Peptoniphilaceae bacterium]|nr:ferrous iron transport protein B [Peptoniphilaceae bacterium]MDY3737929.1 ferrous iron transport protein B [Peptoniphilaceae bacterium]
MSFKIALAGNPNSGKTTLFNALTGSKQRVGNWPGVTVDKKMGILKGHDDIEIEDLPGIYSLSPYTMEEVVSRKYLVEEHPDMIINLVDATNLTRNLYLTSQLIELNIPTVIALNMMDLLNQKGDKIDVKKLEKELGCPVVEIVASKKNGVEKLINKAVNMLKSTPKYPKVLKFSDEAEEFLNSISNIISEKDFTLKRYFSIKAFENDSDALKEINLSSKKIDEITKIREDVENREDDIAESIITTERYDALEKISDIVLKKAPPKLSKTDKIDKIVTNRILGLPIFALVMFAIYFISISTIGTAGTDWLNGFIEDPVQPAVKSFLTGLGINEILIGLVVNGVVGGVGAVIGFLPQMMVLFACLAILEDCGYMSRVAFVMDRILRRFGLSGKSFIPMMIGTGCSVPAIQASRTIENDKDRKITIMTVSFMPCGAKLPVISLIAGSLFNSAAWVSTSIYFVGIFAIIISGVILKKFKSLASEPAPFVMELPQYHLPSIISVLRYTFDKAMSFVKRAGTIIFASTIVLWFLANFDFSFNLVDENGANSILASIGGLLSWIFIPLGFGSWQATVATVTGWIAKENIVATMGVVLGLGGSMNESSPELLQAFASSIGGPIGGYSFLLFNMLCMPCFAAVGAIATEMNSKKWTLAAIGYQMVFSYVIAFIFFNLARFFAEGIFNLWTVIAILLFATLIYMVFRKSKHKERKMEYSVNIAK